MNVGHARGRRADRWKTDRWKTDRWGFELLEPRLAMTGVVINEFLALNTGGVQDQDGDRSDWIELRNTSAAAVNLAGWHLTDDEDDLDKWELPAVNLAPGAYLTVFASGKDRAVAGQELHASFSLDQAGEYLALVAPDGVTVVQEFAPFPPQLANVSYGLGATGTLSEPIVAELANVWVHVPPSGSLGTTWAATGFDHTVWDDNPATGAQGQTGVGFERDDPPNPDYRDYFALDVNALMPAAENRDTIYIRTPFSVTNVGELQSLTLRMRYDDGFVAYLNGHEIAKANAPAAPAWNSQATGTHSDSLAVQYQDIPINQHLDKLVEGDNVLAIHGLNRSSNRNDFLIAPMLVAERLLTSTSEGFMTTPTFGAANSSTTLGVVSDTQFSVDRGFYDTTQFVAITTATADAQIRYTLDGSAPTATSGTVYNGVPIAISTTTTLRAAAFKAGYTPTNVDTQTYIFLDDVIDQDGSGLPAHQNWGHLGPDWEMDPTIVNDPLYAGTIKQDLKSVPSVSLVMPWDTWFGQGGIYISGSTIERSGSIEFINPDGSNDFQIDGSLEIVGGTSDQRWRNDKLSIRGSFKPPFGPAKLDADVFQQQGATTEFDTLIFDAVFNWSWSYGGNADLPFQRTQAKYIQDQWVADLQQRMGGAAPHGRFVHLYLNGLYWGMYYLHERPDSSFAEAYLGGNKDDYDVIKHNLNPSNIVDGDATAHVNYNAMLAAVRANMSVPANYAAVQQWLDIDAFIDYMLINYYAGNTDWAHQNWYASFNRVDPEGRWRFHSWDAEHVLRGSPSFADPLAADVTSKNDVNGPTEIHSKLIANPEYRLRLADRVQKHFHNGGTLTAGVASALYQARMQQVDRAIVAESARWGDNQDDPGYTREHWLATQNNLLANYFPSRTGVVLNQFATRNWLAPVSAPNFSSYGGQVALGYDLFITPPPGLTAYYTIDGSDPRAVGGGINGTLYTMPLDIAAGMTVKARTFDGANWSAVVEATFTVAAPAGATNLRISEIHYNPPTTPGVSDPQELEFIELFNPSAQAVSLDGVQVTEFANTPYSFPNGLTLDAGGRIVIAKNPTVFQQVYGTSINLAPGGFGDANLSNGGEGIALLGALGQSIQGFSFDDVAPWPLAADGGGSSLEIVNPLADPADGANWRASFFVGGSPGTEGLPPLGMPGDFDDDEDVDGGDFLAWQRGVGTTGGATRAMGDGDGDQDVDGNDLMLWGNNFGPAGGSPALALSASASSGSAAVRKGFLSPGQWIVAEWPQEAKPAESERNDELTSDQYFAESGARITSSSYSQLQGFVSPLDVGDESNERTTEEIDLAFETGEMLVDSDL